MAYCLRDLPPCTQTLIDEMGQHWCDLEQLKAAGGTHAARCVKAFWITPARGGAIAPWEGISVQAKYPRIHHVRSYKYNIKDPCERCSGWLRMGEWRRCGACIYRPTHDKMPQRIYNHFWLSDWLWKAHIESRQALRVGYVA